MVVEYMYTQMLFTWTTGTFLVEKTVSNDNGKYYNTLPITHSCTP